MCDHEMHRRGLITLMGAGAALGFLPSAASAATVDVLAITCIDYRLVDDGVKFFDGKKLTNNYDIVALAGASLAAVSDKFPSSNAAIWDHINIAKQLHGIKKVIVLDHRDCGAFKVAYGKAYAGEKAAETAQHKMVMENLKNQMSKKHPELTFECYLMALDGSAERVI